MTDKRKTGLEYAVYRQHPDNGLELLITTPWKPELLDACEFALALLTASDMTGPENAAKSCVRERLQEVIERVRHKE